MGARRLFLLLWAVCLTCASMAITARKDGPTVYVNEMLVWRFRTGNTAKRANESVALLLRAKGSNVGTVKLSRTSYQVKIGSTTVATITSAEAKANSASAAAVAAQWAGRLREAMALPPLVFESSSVQAPQGGRVVIPLLGEKARTAKVEAADPEMVRIRRVASGIELYGQYLGSTTVSASIGGEAANLTVEVLPYATKLPQTVSVYISGAPARPETVQGAIERAVRTLLGSAQGARLTYELPKARTLGSGKMASYAVKIASKAPGAIASEGTATVLVRNMGLVLKDERELWYSNDPESVKAQGPLFAGDLKADTPTRVLYHHMNATASNMTLQVYAVNESELPARLVVVEGDGGTSTNPGFAGCRAAENFLRNWLRGSAEVIEIPAKTGIPISLRSIAPKVTSSGLCSLWLLPGGPDSLHVRVDAGPLIGSSQTATEAMESNAPWRVLGPMAYRISDDSRPEVSPHVYPTPFKQQEVTYSVGGNLGFIRVGEVAIQRADGRSTLQGNYGVNYQINARFENPTQSATTCDLIFETSAGYSGGVFVVDGEIIRTKMVPAKTEIRLARVKLAPGESKQVSVLTLPVSGCAYPITLTLRPAGYWTNLGSGSKIAD